MIAVETVVGFESPPCGAGGVVGAGTKEMAMDKGGNLFIVYPVATPKQLRVGWEERRDGGWQFLQAVAEFWSGR